MGSIQPIWILRPSHAKPSSSKLTDIFGCADFGGDGVAYEAMLRYKVTVEKTDKKNKFLFLRLKVTHDLIAGSAEGAICWEGRVVITELWTVHPRSGLTPIDYHWMGVPGFKKDGSCPKVCWQRNKTTVNARVVNARRRSDPSEMPRGSNQRDSKGGTVGGYRWLTKEHRQQSVDEDGNPNAPARVLSETHLEDLSETRRDASYPPIQLVYDSKIDHCGASGFAPMPKQGPAPLAETQSQGEDQPQDKGGSYRGWNPKKGPYGPVRPIPDAKPGEIYQPDWLQYSVGLGPQLGGFGTRSSPPGRTSSPGDPAAHHRGARRSARWATTRSTVVVPVWWEARRGARTRGGDAVARPPCQCHDVDGLSECTC